ncbi:uncharacterized protein G2W53_024633 [Senna tora]|uniref:Uncharacterized protein n=1 Tax=Senna tora TaxID=362788 RepID=A0A834TBM3_9FABA|nr:uncharacterized protein G2W53_024633 [Senna tora]
MELQTLHQNRRRAKTDKIADRVSHGRKRTT